MDRIPTKESFENKGIIETNYKKKQLINFTIEWEENNSLPFLDVTLHRNLSHFQFSIYRKPTHSGMFLHYFSYQHEHIKRGVLLSQLLRAYRLCDPQFLATELKYLNVTFSRLGYPDHLIQSAHAAARSRFYACVDGEGELAELAPVLVLLLLLTTFSFVTF